MTRVFDSPLGLTMVQPHGIHRLSQLAFTDVYVRIDRAEQARYNPVNRHLGGRTNLPVPESMHDDIERLRLTLTRREDSDFSLVHDNVRLRASRQALSDGSIWAAMRRVDSSLAELDQLGIRPKLLAHLKSLGRRTGLVLIVGSTGHGKSTTAAALLRHYLSVHGGVALTLEDPVEQFMQGAVGDNGFCFQIQVEHDADWAIGIKSALRWNPSYIFVGEVRTADAAAQLLRAAVSGQMVIATAHGGSIEEGLMSLVHLAEPVVGERAHALLADGLVGVLHQSLTPTGPDIRFVFTKEGDTGDAVRNCLRENQGKSLGTYIDQQRIRLLGAK
jgi:Tfp pilus assembly pilus retraction ATPase PilT